MENTLSTSLSNLLKYEMLSHMFQKLYLSPFWSFEVSCHDAIEPQTLMLKEHFMKDQLQIVEGSILMDNKFSKTKVKIGILLWKQIRFCLLLNTWTFQLVRAHYLMSSKIVSTLQYSIYLEEWISMSQFEQL